MPARTRTRARLMARMGAEVVRFQDESAAFDAAAARVLGLDRDDLPCLSLLFFAGPAPVARVMAALHTGRSALTATFDRLQRAGYVRRQPAARPARFELTAHARQWIAHIWAPLREQGGQLMGTYSTSELTLMCGFMIRARRMQARQVRQLRTWLEQPASPARRAHLRGGLSPAALRRVQVFVEANLGAPVRLGDLAQRAGLSAYHFARAFRVSTGATPLAFVEQRRVATATHLLDASSDSLAAIAAACGFSTQSRFTTVFKRRTGFTPGAYRRTSSAAGRATPGPAGVLRFSAGAQAP